MSLTPLFECFDAAPTPEPEGPSEGWQEGYDAGLAEGRALAEAEAAALRQETAQVIADLGLTFEEAQSHVLARLAPLFSILAKRVVPDILQATLGVALRDELALAAQADAGVPLSLRLAPADMPAIEAVLPLIPGTQVTVHADPRLGPGEVLIDRGEGATALDLDRLGRDVSAALFALSDSMQGQQDHG